MNMHTCHTTLLCRGRLIDLSEPQVMGILNLTPDSFYDGGRHTLPESALRQTEIMLKAGAIFIDAGGASSRPGAEEVPVEAELSRVIPVIEAIVRCFPEAFISVDTWRAEVARAACEAGAGMVNDISAGRFDTAMYETLQTLGVPYVLMHMQGTPQTMQQDPHYQNVVNEVLEFFIGELEKLRSLGIKDIVLDPGFGFGKTVSQNFQLLDNLDIFEKVLGLPVLAGISRKSMICKVLKVSPENALNGTTALHMVALQRGARILRAHDVKEAVETIRLWECLRDIQSPESSEASKS